MTIEEFKKIMTDDFLSKQEVLDAYGITPSQITGGATWETLFSALSIENMLFYSTAAGMYVLQELLTRHETDIADMLARQRAGSAAWYAWMARRFRLGQSLIAGSDLYDDTGLTPAQITQMQIVTQASATEAADRSVLYLKIAKGAIGSLTQLTPTEQDAFTDYIRLISYAGVRYEVINAPADDFRLWATVYYDPLVLNAQGQRLDGTAKTPVQTAIRHYLQALPFDGIYSNQALTDALQQVEGVRIFNIESAEAQRSNNVGFWKPIPVFDTPYSGYYALADGDLNLEFSY